MLDNELIKLIIATIIEQEAIAGIANLPIAQAFQPTQQGVPTAKTAFIFKIGDHRRGSQQRKDEYVPASPGIPEQIVHTEIQVYETTFQFSALATQIPNSITQYTASDILNLIAYIIQSEATKDAFIAKGVGVLKVEDVDNPYFSDDRARNEANPTFDFTVTHNQIVRSQTAMIQSTEIQVLTV